MSRNDGGIVYAMVLLVGSIEVSLVTAVLGYHAAVQKATRMPPLDRTRHLLRLLSGWGNIANAISHGLLLLVLTGGDTQRYIDRGIDPSNPKAVVVVTVLNAVVGLRSLCWGGSSKIPFGWIMYMSFGRGLIPVMWFRVFSEGCTIIWPYEFVFVWLNIFAFESLAFFASMAWFFLERAIDKKDSYSEVVVGVLCAVYCVGIWLGLWPWLI